MRVAEPRPSQPSHRDPRTARRRIDRADRCSVERTGAPRCARPEGRAPALPEAPPPIPHRPADACCRAPPLAAQATVIPVPLAVGSTAPIGAASSEPERRASRGRKAGLPPCQKPHRPSLTVRPIPGTRRVAANRARSSGEPRGARRLLQLPRPALDAGLEPVDVHAVGVVGCLVRRRRPAERPDEPR